MKVIWTLEAEQDRIDIWDYIAADNPQAAARLDQLFSDAVSHLSEYPLMGKQGKIPETRELIPHENYRLVYQINNESVWILALVHAARHWPTLRDQP